MEVTQQWTEAQYKMWMEDRQRARTDLFWLANDVLNYDWVCHSVHDPMIEFLPKFPGGRDKFNFETKEWFGYLPFSKIEEVDKECLRSYLLLYPRGTLKTTIATVSLDIQIILNFPDVRIALATAVGEQGQAAFDSIRKQFQFNDKLRLLFPELCPKPNKAMDWGNMESFTVLGRHQHRKEPTMSLISVGKVIAGYHYDVLQVSDIVDVNNSSTPGQLSQVIKFMGYCEPLVELYPNGTTGWKIVEGTTYDFADYYGVIRDSEQGRKPEDKRWKILVKSAVNQDGTALWPERLPLSRLKDMEDDPTIGTYLVASQYYMNPIPTGGGLADRNQIIFTKADVLDQLRPMLRIYCTIDLAGMEESTKVRNDDTVLNTSGWDRDGRLYGIDIRVGKFSPHTVIDQMFDIDKRYHPIAFKIEKDAHARVLLPFLRREMEKRNQFLVIVEIKRDNRTSKKQRISGLQSWFQAGLLRFSDSLQCKGELINQIVRFSQTSTYHDDILDTVVDHCFSRDGDINYDVIPNPERTNVVNFPRPEEKFQGFDPFTGRPNWSNEKNLDERYYNRFTGIL